MKGFCVTEHFSIVNSQVSFHLGAHIGLDAKSIFLTKSHMGRQEKILLSLPRVKKHWESKVMFLSGHGQVRFRVLLLAIVVEVTFCVDTRPA